MRPAGLRLGKLAEHHLGEAELGVGDGAARGVVVPADGREARERASLSRVPRRRMVTVDHEEKADRVRASDGIHADEGILARALGVARAPKRGGGERVQGHERARAQRELVLDEGERAGRRRAGDQPRGMRRLVRAEDVGG